MKDPLSNNRHATLLVRLLLDQTGHLVYGEALDLNGQSLGRFRVWQELGQLVRDVPRDPGPA